MKKIMFGLLAAMAISNAQAEGNFLNLASKPAKIDFFRQTLSQVCTRLDERQ
ncbi:hypothetical protein ACEREP_002091 [Neisseria gonorrhoeae]